MTVPYNYSCKAALTVVLIFFSNLAIVSNAKDHPLLESYPGAEIEGASTKSSLNYVIAKSAMRDGKLDDVLDLRGKLSHLQYSIPETETIEAVYQSYTAALETAEFSDVYACRKTECGGDIVSALFGGSNRSADYSNVADDVLNDDNTDFYYLSAKRSIDDDRDVFVTIILRQITIASWPVKMTQDVLEVESLKPKAIKINVDYPGDLSKYGKVTLEGLFFETNESVLTRESMPALKEIAAFMSLDKTQKFYVVGHTDSEGTYQHNLRLSKARAVSVAKHLVADFGIEEDRVVPLGVGPVVPVTTNRTNSGQASNRRVELVLQ